MDFFSVLMNDPIVAAGVAVIACTTGIVGYLAYFFIKNIIKAKDSG